MRPKLLLAATQASEQETIDWVFTGKKYDKGRREEATALITETIVVDMQPLSMVEDAGFNALMAYLEPDYKMPCREKKVTARTEKMYNDCSASTKHELSNGPYSDVNNRWTDLYENTVMHHCNEPSH